MAIAADWRNEPVYLKNVARNKSLGIQTSPHWPFEFRLYAAIGRADIYENRGDPIAWSFRPGVAPETYTIVGKPTPKTAGGKVEDYGLCAHMDSGFRLVLWQVSRNADNPDCSWKVEDQGDGRIRLRNYGLDTRIGGYVGRLRCEFDYDCGFDNNKLSNTDPLLLFEYRSSP